MCNFKRNSALCYVIRNILIYQCPSDVMTLAHSIMNINGLADDVISLALAINIHDDVTGGAYMPIWRHVFYVIFLARRF